MRNFHSYTKVACLFLVFVFFSCVSPVSRVPDISIDPTTNDFGLIDIGSSSTPFTFTLESVGTATLKITSIDLTGANPGDFSISAIVPMDIKASSNQSFTVTFTPTAWGARNAELSITHNVISSPSSITLSGVGTNPLDPLFSIAPTSQDFGLVRIGENSNPFTFTITNVGNSILNVTNIDLTGADAGEFSLNTVLPMDIDPGNNSDFTVTFSPTSIGVKNATLTITHNAFGSPSTVTLTGKDDPSIALFEDDFTTDMGWWVLDSGNLHTGSATWDFFTSDNNTGGSGQFIGANSELNSIDFFDEYIISPDIDCTAYTTGKIMLEFDGNYQDFDPNPDADIGGLAVWDGFVVQVMEEYSSDWNSNGEHKSYDVSIHAYGNPFFAFFFYYRGEADLYFKVDNVILTYTP